MNADEYMEKNNLKAEDLKAEWRPQAETDVKFELILQKYGEANKIEPTEEDYAQNLASLDDQTRKMYNNDEERLKGLIRYYYINQRSYIEILDKVKSNSASPEGKTEAGEKPKKQPKKSEKKKAEK